MPTITVMLSQPPSISNSIARTRRGVKSPTSWLQRKPKLKSTNI